MDKQKPFTVVKPVKMPELGGPISYAVKVKPGAKLIFCSGLAPRDKEGKGLIGYPTYTGLGKTLGHEAGEYTQAIRVMERLEGVLAGAGATFDDVVSAHIWITNIRYWRKVLEAFSRSFKNHYPAVTVTAITQLGIGQLVEIECVAAI